MHERVTVKRDGRQVDRGWLIERTTEHVLIESDRAGVIAAHPVREFSGDVTVRRFQVAASAVTVNALRARTPATG